MTLLQDAIEIRDETIPNANTAFRVGTVHERTINGTVITPPALVANVDDYNPAGLDYATHIRIEATAGGGRRRVTGVQAPPAGDNRIITFIPLAGANNFRFDHNSGASLAANRFLMARGGNQNVDQEEGTVSFWYDHGIQRWWQIAGKDT